VTSAVISALLRKQSSKESLLVEPKVQSPHGKSGKSLQVITMTGHKGKEANSTVKYMWGME
jgi:hypothetical protein